MIVIACLDDNGGMMFNHRRQSQDRMLRAHIAALVGGAMLCRKRLMAITVLLKMPL